VAAFLSRRMKRNTRPGTCKRTRSALTRWSLSRIQQRRGDVSDENRDEDRTVMSKNSACISGKSSFSTACSSKNPIRIVEHVLDKYRA